MLNVVATFAGFEQLCSVDTRFEPFQTTLFSQAGLELNRNERTKADNESLDASLGAYLCLLTDHFLSEVSFQTLEYLIRRYRWGCSCLKLSCTHTCQVSVRRSSDQGLPVLQSQRV